MNALNKKLPLIVICGRTNVGKSTLFNCLAGEKRALVAAIPGTTRDSNIGAIEWGRHKFCLVDTGGLINMNKLNQAISKKTEDKNNIDYQVEKQARDYIKRADLILLVVDNKTGLLLPDKQLALFLKKTSQADIILVVNKVDSIKQAIKAAEFHQLAFKDTALVSAATGAGTGDLLDLVIKKTKNKATPAGDSLKETLKISIIGQPNVGKSTLLNSLLGYERVIVSSVPHTTREPQHTLMAYQDKIIKLIDTAGISKHGAKTAGLEKYGIIKSLAALKKSDIVLLVLDISEKITHQDAKIVEEIFEQQKSMIIIANKWDLIKEKDTKKFTNYIYARLPFAHFAPILFVSALTAAKVKNILGLVFNVAEQRQRELSEEQLQNFLRLVTKKHKPTKGRGVKHPFIRKIKQIQANPPQFAVFIGAREDLDRTYLRYLANQVRERFGFLGTPIKIKVNPRTKKS